MYSDYQLFLLGWSLTSWVVYCGILISFLIYEDEVIALLFKYFAHLPWLASFGPADFEVDSQAAFK